MKEQWQITQSHHSDGVPTQHHICGHSQIWCGSPNLNPASGDTCVLRLTSADGYSDSLSFALHPDGSNHDWVYDTAEGKESLILWGMVNLTDISVIRYLWIYLSTCKKPTETAELHKNDSNNNRNSKLHMTLPKYFQEQPKEFSHWSLLPLSRFYRPLLWSQKQRHGFGQALLGKSLLGILSCLRPKLSDYQILARGTSSCARMCLWVHNVGTARRKFVLKWGKQEEGIVSAVCLALFWCYFGNMKLMNKMVTQGREWGHNPWKHNVPQCSLSSWGPGNLIKEHRSAR